ncbi:unnamed protein product [Owenia fusiformis]|uniref:Kinesin motor domain-containing protein n=1 Tax=Owenia fusiformis TaxID=6347 RepID=A0A8S4NXA5_OWEFU|nr:unnamed protein product [Owenia fusiformis]
MAEESRDSNDGTSVRVAIRIRPQNARERIDMCQVCTFITPGEPQVTLGNDKCFTYDSVFNVDSTQEEIYDSTARGLIEGCFEGYNATIFAYGQTGSGKTFTMGTGFEPDILPEIVGIIPRAVAHLFNGIEKRRDDAIKNQLPPPDFKVHAEFMELYNEEIIDLLDTTRDPTEKGRKSHIKIHEDAFGGIYTVGVTTQVVTSLDDTMQCLKVGALSRTTASTNMNATSSRSHAIFTLHVKQHRVVREDQDGEEGEKETDTTEVMNEFETLTAKFHFVDLAGSERLKRTGATGDRMKEGISINSGLLALGNVISALGDKTKKGSHVPYRDSKLTRLLQDSLGGNSRTQMIACVSPCDRDFMETLSTLKYANRARNIRNKVSVNQDKTSKQIAALRQEIILLQEELMEYKTGKRTMDADGSEALNDLVTENAMIQTDNKNLRARIKALQETIEHLQARNTQLLADKAILDFQNISGDAPSDEVTSLVKGYIHEIEELRTRLTESEAMCETIKRTASHSRTPTRASPSSSNIFDYGHTSRISGTFSPDNNLNAVIEEAKRDIAKAKKKVKRTKSTSESDKENVESKANKEADENEKVEDDEEDDVDDEDDNDEDDDDVDDDEDEEVSSDSDSEEKGNEIISEELANITCDINIKEQLIEKLESSQKQMNAMKQHYEEKLKSLSQRIKDTEKERDQVLQSLEKDHSSEKVAKVRDEFKKKLNDLQSDLKKMSAATKEHAKLVKNNTSYQMQLKTATKELSDMKKLKVKLMKQMKEEAQKSKQAEMRNQREVMGLKREQRKKEGRIKSLEIENRQKEIVLRRKQEEMLAMRRKEQQRPMSAKAAGRIGSYDRPLTRPVDPISRRRRKGEFSAKAAKQKWDTLEKNVIKTVSRKQTLIAIEKDMDLWLKRRDELIKKTEKRKATRDNALKMGNKTPEDMRVLDEQISSLQMQVNDAQDRISDCQNEIMEMEESRDMEDLDPAPLLEKCNLQEAKYLIEHFMALAVNKGLACMQKENEVKEISANLHRFEVQNKFQYDLLQHIVVDSVHGEFDDSLLGADQGADQESDSTSTSRSSSPIDSDTYRMMEAQELLIGRGSLDNVARPNKGETKARRKTATTEDLLFCGGSEENIIPVLPIMPEEHEEMKQTNTNSLLPDKKPSLDSLLMPPPSRVKTLEKVSSDSNIPRNTRPTSVPVQKDQNAVKNDRGISPQYGSGRLSARQTPEPSPVLRRKNIPAVIQPTKTQTPSSVSGDAPKSNTSLFKRSRSLRMSKVEKQNKINKSATSPNEPSNQTTSPFRRSKSLRLSDSDRPPRINTISSSSISSSGSTSDAPLTPIPPERRNSFTLSTDQNANNFKWSQRQTSM